MRLPRLLISKPEVKDVNTVRNQGPAGYVPGWEPAPAAARPGSLAIRPGNSHQGHGPASFSREQQGQLERIAEADLRELGSDQPHLPRQYVV
jgi:hypothetical protein